MTVEAGLRIAVIGSRGIPAGYGGFETFAEELCPRLVELGHDVTVYCRKGYTGEETAAEYKGVKLRYPPHFHKRMLEQLSHEAACILDSLRLPFDLYYFLGTRSAPLYVPLKASKRIVVVNTDGLEWRRRKWSHAGRSYLRFAEWVAVRVAADELVSDAEAMVAYFLRTYGRTSTFLTNGANVLSGLPDGALDEWGLEPGGYYLVACRIEPENNVDLIIREFLISGSDRPLVIAGGMNYQTDYWENLHRLARGGPIRFLGPVYGGMRVEYLHLGAYAYLHGHEVGGTNPSLLKAMGCGNLALALHNTFNADVLAGTGLLWQKRPGSLADQIRWAEANPQDVAHLGIRAQDRIRECYTWAGAAEAHDAFFRRIARARGIRA
jgi:glycosyltransferase involved in cell wall biosynthesis